MKIGIPGEVIATVEFGRVRITFTPSASAAGYFGPAAVVFEGDDVATAGLQMEDTDGPFWRMVQASLAETNGLIEWTE